MEDIENINSRQAGFLNRLLGALFIISNTISIFLLLQMIVTLFQLSPGDSIIARLLFLTILTILLGILYPKFRTFTRQTKYISLLVSFLLMLLLAIILIIGSHI